MAAHRSMMVERSHEMMQKPLRDTFFSLKNASQRPVSVTTEFMETDWEMDDHSDVHSEFEEDGEASPRGSFHSANSSGQPSITTLSSYEEVHTPRSSEQRFAFALDIDTAKPVEGPRGPHLFRSSIQSADSVEFQNALSLSPVTPRVGPKSGYEAAVVAALAREKHARSQPGFFEFTDEELDTADLPDWTPEKVAQWMLNAGVELSAAEPFVENDINGAILITLKFEDLRELGISSFGVRTKVWEQIHVMRNIRPVSPRPETPIEDEPSREVKREQRKLEGGANPTRNKSKRGAARPCGVEDIISPLESVSIVGIEQVMPKPHSCSKGENCPKWRKNKRLMDAFMQEHPHIRTNEGRGVILVAGDPGNPATAEALNKPPSGDVFRPMSDAIPSVVASSDVMGPGMPALQYLQEASLRNIMSRDPQDNVRQFLDFQQGGVSGEVPPTPPFEIYPGQNSPQEPHHGLRGLPRLAIPSSQVPRGHLPAASAALFDTETEVDDDDDDAESSSSATPTGVYRFGTPFSEMDVPVTAIPLGPVARETSQSVPPDMNYRHHPNPPVRSASRTARRPSLNVLPALDEDRVTAIQSKRPSPAPPANPTAARPPPPRVQYPWSQPNRPRERAIPPIPGAPPPASAVSGSDVSHQGPMKKRKTKLLRHEWHEHYFTLRGTRLNMHKDALQTQRTLEYIDVDDYAIACSSAATGSKLNAAFKAMNIRRGSNPEKSSSSSGGGSKADIAAFSFQLIPQDTRVGGMRLRKRESGMSALSGLMGSSSSAASASTPSLVPPPEGAANGTGKTHHFAVKGRDERIDWMRELMLAKALKQKGDGFEVSVNGNMI